MIYKIFIQTEYFISHYMRLHASLYLSSSAVTRAELEKSQSVSYALCDFLQKI